MSDAKKTEKEPTPNEGRKGIILGSMALVLFIILVRFLFFSSNGNDTKNDESNNSKANTENSVKTDWVVTKEITIQIGENIGTKYNISNGEGLSFKNATVPYCVTNESGIPVCGVEGEDISSKLDKKSPNLEFTFNSSNSKKGQITLVHWKKVQVK